MTIQELEERIVRIQELSEKQEKINKKLRRIIMEENVNKKRTEIDEFDALLGELDDLMETPVEEVVVEDIAEVREVTKVAEVKEEKEEVKEAVDTIADIDASTNEIVDELNSQIASLKSTIKSLQSSAQDAKKEATVNLPELEYSEEGKAYARAVLDLDVRKKALAQEGKDLKAEYEDQGVDTKSVMTSLKEISKEIKETAQEAQLIEATKQSLRDDDGIFGTINALAN